MALFIISIPFMVLAVVLAVLPLIVMSFADRHRTTETISTAAVLGAGFLYLVTRWWGMAQNGQVGGRDAMRVFGYSITYLTVLFVAMAGDVLVSNHVHIN